MANKKRETISKKTRFEVFKRDSFKCQYCGKSAPEVVLEVDHIKPVAEGGKTTMLNLITACRDCNRGKGKRKLDDKTELAKQKAELDLLNEKRLQMEMLLEWKKELSEIIENQVDILELELVDVAVGYRLTTETRKKLKALIKEFGFNEVYEACERATLQYPLAYDRIKKIGGICYNRRKAGGKDGN